MGSGQDLRELELDSDSNRGLESDCRGFGIEGFGGGQAVSSFVCQTTFLGDNADFDGALSLLCWWREPMSHALTLFIAFDWR